MHPITRKAAGLLLVAHLATAQIKLPQPSQSATIMQSVGATDFTIKYARPNLRGREAFTSAFVPYGKVWRTGANAATAFMTSTDVIVNGKTLPAGTYAMLSIPAQNEWILIFSKNQTVTETTYKEDEDALRVPIKAMASGEKMESFTINFSDLTDSTAKLNMLWGSVKATADLMVNTSANAAANVDKAVAEKPEDAAILQAAASYNLSKGRNLDQALAWADKSIGLKETYRNVWLKAQILGKMGKPAEALPLAKKALSMGQTSNDAAFPFFKESMEKGITDFTAQLPAMPAKGIKGKKKA